MRRPLWFHLIILFTAAASAAAPPSAFEPPPIEGRTVLVSSTSGEIVLRHQWGHESPDQTAVAVLLPPASPVRCEATRWQLQRTDGDPRLVEIGEAMRLPRDIGASGSARFEEMGWIRGWRLGRVSLLSQTTSALPSEEGMWRVRGVEVAIRLSSPETGGAEPDHPLIASLVERLVINPGDVSRWRQLAGPVPEGVETQDWHPTPETGRWVRLTVAHDGPVWVGLDALAAAGVSPEAVDVDRVEVVRNGEPVPLLIDTEGRGFHFVSQGQERRDVPGAAFWLDLAGSGAPARMARVLTRDATEEETVRHPLLETVIERDGENPDEAIVDPIPHGQATLEFTQPVWTWAELRVGEGVASEIPALPGEWSDREPLGTAGFDLITRRNLRGVISSLLVHSSGASAETMRVDNVRFASHASTEVTVDLLDAPGLAVTAQSLLTPEQREAMRTGETSELRLDKIVLGRPIASVATGTEASGFVLVPAPGAEAHLSEVWVPEASVVIDVASTPPRAFMLREESRRGQRQLVLPRGGWRIEGAAATAFATPESIVPWTPPNLRQPRRADMIIITHPDLRAAAERLAAHHRREFAVEVVETHEIFDEFSGGDERPEAIRAFLAAALRDWRAPAPSIVTFLGDCNRDRRGVWRSGVVNHVPTYSEPNPVAREVNWQANELRHVLVSGDDSFGDLLLGRLSAEDLDAAMALVDKVISYADHAPAGEWRSRIGLIADNDAVGSTTFDAMCEEVRRESVAAGMRGRTVYLRELPLSDNQLIPEEMVTETNAKVSDAATNAIRDMFNDGAALVVYYGHGGPNLWADERIWFACDSPRRDSLLLEESDRPAFLINMTCSSGAIDFPDPYYHVCISEDFLRSPGGAIACYVPTGEGMPTQHQRLTHRLMEALFRDGVREIGPATTLASWRYLTEGRGSDLVEHFVLLGDPALSLALPQVIREQPAPGTPLAAGASHELRIEVTPQSIESGSAQVWLLDPAGRTVETRELHGDGAAPLAPMVFTIPPDGPLGRWTAAAHWTGDDGRRDELISASAVVAAPRVTLVSWSFTAQGDVIRAGDRVEAIAELRNDGGAATGPVRVAANSLTGDGATLDEATVTLEPGERAIVTMAWTARAGLHLIGLTLPERPGLWSDASGPLLSQPLRLAVIDPAEPARLVAVPLPGGIQVLSQDSTRATAVRVCVANVGSTEARDAQVTAMDATGINQVAEPVLYDSLRPGLMQEATLAFFIPMETSGEVRVRSDWRTGTDASAEVGRSAFQLALAEPRPDLVVVTAECTVRPETPTDGETIFVDATVHNRGERDATRVSVALSDVDGAPLRDRANPRSPLLDRVPAGDSRTVRLRWDPTGNAGEQTIRVTADAERSISESDESNNTATLTVRVRTKADVHFTRPVEMRYPQSGRVTLATELVNSGESDALDYVVTWYRYSDRQHRLGETVVPRLRAGERQPVAFEWIYTPAEQAMHRAGVQPRPVADVGRRTGLRRAASHGAEDIQP